MLATISTDSGARRATSDEAGRFTIRGFKPGRVGFHVLRIGYEPIAFVLDLPADSTVHVEIRLHGTPLLQTVIVQGDAPSERLARTGFYWRRSHCNGEFLTPAQVDSSVANSPSELLRAFHGIDVICGKPWKTPQSRLHVLPPTTGGGCTMKSRGAGCLWVLVDGHPVDAELYDITSRAAIAAVEFHERSNNVPAELQGAMGDTPCGVVAVWTNLVAR